MSNFHSTLDTALADPCAWVKCRSCGQHRKLAISKASERHEAEARPCRACANRNKRQGKAT